MAEILQTGELQGYSNFCPICRKTIRVNIQGNEIGSHDCTPTPKHKENFEIGELVEWESQAGGFSKSKMGAIYFKIPANVSPLARHLVEQYNPPNEKRCIRMFDGLLPRNHESYIIIVPSKSGRGKAKLYLPFVSKLKKVK